MLELIKAIAPTLATMFGGPLAGTAVKVIADALGEPDAPESKIQDMISKGLSPDQLQAIQQADKDLKIKMREMDISLEQAYIADAQDARKNFSDDTKVFWLGVAQLVAFLVVAVVAIAGAYYLLFSGEKFSDGTLAAVFGLIGSVVGYMAANAQQVIGFFFGSSQGSKHKTDAMAESFKSLRLGNRP